MPPGRVRGMIRKKKKTSNSLPEKFSKEYHLVVLFMVSMINISYNLNAWFLET